MKKALFITTQFPYPPDNGGKMGALTGIQVVSSLYKTTVLSFTEESDQIKNGLSTFMKLYPDVNFYDPVFHEIHIRKKFFKLLIVILSSFFSGRPYATEKFNDKNMKHVIDRLFCDNKKWDLIFIDYINVALYGDYIKRKYKDKYGTFIFKDHNIEYEIVKQEAESSHGVKRLFLDKLWKKTREYEISQIRSADIAFSVCEENTAFLKKYNKDSFTMGPIINMLPNRKAIPHSHTILYIGNLSWKANMDGIKWFVSKVFPMIKERFEDVSFTIVGSGPAENPFDGVAGISYRGYVDNLSYIYSEHRVFIVPLFEGSGIRIKILEAMNNEIPIVSTKIGCETIVNGCDDDKGILSIANDPKEFSDSIIKLFLDDKYWIETVDRAKSYLSEKYNKISRIDEFKKIIRSKGML